jgi:hypothetical protein
MRQCGIPARPLDSAPPVDTLIPKRRYCQPQRDCALYKNKRRRSVESGRYCSDMIRVMRYPNRIVGLHHAGDIGLTAALDFSEHDRWARILVTHESE